MVGNYHDPKSEDLLIAALEYFGGRDQVMCLVVNRTDYEKRFILKNLPLALDVRFLENAVDGLQLLYAADIAVSGGGTMNREAALLGTPACSIFTGRRPYLDEYLADSGRLTFIGKPSDFGAVGIHRKPKKPFRLPNSNLAEEVVDILVDKMNP